LSKVRPLNIDRKDAEKKMEYFKIGGEVKIHPRRNFFIFSTKKKSTFNILLKHMIYAAKLQRPEHRVLANFKEGDLCFLYVMEERALYGVFEAIGRVFEGPTDIELGGDWPHMIPFRLWGSHVGVIRGGKMAELMTFISKEISTISDVSELHRRYLNTLLYDEGTKLLKFFIKKCLWKRPVDISLDFARNPIIKPPLDARSLMTGKPKEYVVELYLLQNLNKLEELIGGGLTEVYNQLYGYQNRYLDILALHKQDNELLKATVIEIKTSSSPQNLKKGLYELAHYMYWVTDKITHDPDITFGLLLTPQPEKNAEALPNEAKMILEPFGIKLERVLWVSYKIERNELLFTPIS